MGWTAEDQRDWLLRFLAHILEDAGFGDIDVIIADGLRSLLPTWPKIVMDDPAARRLRVVIIETISHWVGGWIDWNLALDLQGGPNWVNNFVDSPIIVDSKSDEFYKQPTFYVMGHFSKYVPPDSAVRIATSNEGPQGVSMLGFRRPDNATVIVFLNTQVVEMVDVRTMIKTSGSHCKIPCLVLIRNSSDRIISVSDISKGRIPLSLPGKSIHTLIYW